VARHGRGRLAARARRRLAAISVDPQGRAEPSRGAVPWRRWIRLPSSPTTAVA
jgi:hypothetical protein